MATKDRSEITRCVGALPTSFSHFSYSHVPSTLMIGGRRRYPFTRATNRIAINREYCSSEIKVTIRCVNRIPLEKKKNKNNCQLLSFNSRSIPCF